MTELLSFILINLLGAISPGADFAIVTHYGLQGARRSALLATLGIAAALLIHVLYCVIGVAWFLQNSPHLFLAIQLTGAAYLAYLGIRMFQPSSAATAAPSDRKAFATGFLTNLLNPKAALFLLSLFSQFITPTTTPLMKFAFGATIPLVALSWFSLLSYLLTHRNFLPHLQRYQNLFSKVMSALLILLALSVTYMALKGK